MRKLNRLNTLRLICSLLLFIALGGNALAKPPRFIVAENGRALCGIYTNSTATEAEHFAAGELAATLSAVTGAEFKVLQSSAELPPQAIVVGPGELASAYFPETDLAGLGPEECVMQVKNDRLLLAGGRPRGTVYAVSRFLQEQCGVRWWTPWASSVPKQNTLSVPSLNVRKKPAFEYRASFWFSAFDPRWKALNCDNSEHGGCASQFGSCVKYKGFAHTFNLLVPPEKHFFEHPEWFSMINGQRSTNRSQLCLTDPKLRDFVVERVRQWLREAPEAQIVSVTQNDHSGWCECPRCKALDDAEESHSGTMLAFANYVAEKIEPEFPAVAVDTFAYQYTRKPPRTLKARHNVIVRLCSIECNFREPLEHWSNAAFAEDIRGWSKICSRLYVWDYTTDFRAYTHPHPNWFTLGPNVRFFQEHGVQGLFEQGAYQGNGSEMGEMRAWVLAQLLWNPRQDDQALIREFLRGYYGEAAARIIEEYLRLIHARSEGLFLGCYLPRETPHLNLETLSAAERLWSQAEAAVANDPELLIRVRIGHLPVRFAFLKNWNRLRREAWEQNVRWPLAESRDDVARMFRSVCQGVAGKPWTKVSRLNEGGLEVEAFLAGLPAERADFREEAPPRLTHPPAPADIVSIDAARCVDLQDNIADLSRPGKLADIHVDPAASDLRAVWMPADHQEKAFRIRGAALPVRALQGRWNIQAVARIKSESEECRSGTAIFSGGVYDNKAKAAVLDSKVVAGKSVEQYCSYDLGTARFSKDCDIWIAPATNSSVKAVWVDRVYLTPAK